jgi:hypothetical protein
MTKKEYMQPALNVVEIRHSDILTISGAKGGYYEGDIWHEYFEGGYNPNGQDPIYAW